MLLLDGVYVDRGGKIDRFRWVKAPTTAELSELTHTIAYRIGRYLERQGLLVRDAEHSYLALDEPDGAVLERLSGRPKGTFRWRTPSSNPYLRVDECITLTSSYRDVATAMSRA